MSRWIRLNLSFVLMVCLMWGAFPVSGQSTPVGNEFQVNSDTTGRQYVPHAAADAQGNYIVSWVDFLGTSARQVFSDGSLGPQFLANSAFLSDVARAPDGRFVIAYREDGGSDSIAAQIYDAAGVPQGSEVMVSDNAGLQLARLAVDMADNDGFVVVWGDSDGQVDIFGRQMLLDGTAAGDVFTVNSYVTGAQGEPAVAVDDDGDFFVAWTSRGGFGNDNQLTSIQGRLYASDGQPLGDQFQVNTITLQRQDRPAVASLLDGTWVVAWADGSEVVDTNQQGIAAQRFDAGGGFLGGPLAVNTYTTGFQTLPDVAPLSDGGFFVTWESRGSPGSDNLVFSVQGRVYDSVGLPAGDQFQINSYAPNTQSRAKVATGPDSSSLVVWESIGSAADDTDRESIQGQFFGPLLPEVFADGFESGDTLSWAGTEP